MNALEKPDAQAFRNCLTELRQSVWLDKPRRWWVDFAFHHTHIENAVKILKAGFLLSRSEIQKSGTFTDSASQQVIQQTTEDRKRYVRFYFRPRTPTFYHCEGIRPINHYSLDAHCPVPVYLLFDLEKLICRADSHFTQGNLASAGTTILSTAQDFNNLPFTKIYHDSSFTSEDRDAIIFHRHAEIIVPRKVDLNLLKGIWCRSQAEYDTLRYLLADDWDVWQNKIAVSGNYSLFKRQWLYVDKAELSLQRISLYCHQPYENVDQGPFALEIKILETSTGLYYSAKFPDYRFDSDENCIIGVKLGTLTAPENYRVHFYVDDILAYAGQFNDADDIPF